MTKIPVNGYVLIQLIVSYVTIMFFLVLLVYGIKSYIKQKNILYGIPCAVVLASVLNAKIFFNEISNEISSEQSNYSIYLDTRMEIVKNIEEGIWGINEVGIIELPPEYGEGSK